MSYPFTPYYYIYYHTYLIFPHPLQLSYFIFIFLHPYYYIYHHTLFLSTFTPTITFTTILYFYSFNPLLLYLIFILPLYLLSYSYYYIFNHTWTLYYWIPVKPVSTKVKSRAWFLHHYYLLVEFTMRALISMGMRGAPLTHDPVGQTTVIPPALPQIILAPLPSLNSYSHPQYQRRYIIFKNNTYYGGKKSRNL